MSWRVGRLRFASSSRYGVGNYTLRNPRASTAAAAAAEASIIPAAAFKHHLQGKVIQTCLYSLQKHVDWLFDWLTGHLKLFESLKRQIDVSKLHQISSLPDFEAIKTWNGRSVCVKAPKLESREKQFTTKFRKWIGLVPKFSYFFLITFRLRVIGRHVIEWL